MFQHPISQLTIIGLAVSLCIGAAASATTPVKPAETPVPAQSEVPVEAAPAIIERACQSCHDLGVIKQARHTPEEWAIVIGRMRSNGAEITDTDAKTVLAYLTKTNPPKP